jgi:hypothetical protein
VDGMSCTCAQGHSPQAGGHWVTQHCPFWIQLSTPHQKLTHCSWSPDTQKSLSKFLGALGVRERPSREPLTLVLLKVLHQVLQG